jgi:hypothetical protein
MLGKLIRSKYILALIFIVGFLVRLYGFDNPVADWHSWRQADTSSVSRNFTTRGFDILHPTYQDLSNVPSGTDNPKGYRFVEFPIYNVLQAGTYSLFGVFSLEEWGRLITIFSSLFSAWFLYALVKKYADRTAALCTLFFYLFLPFNIYFSRTILPDPNMVAATLAAIYFFDLWTQGYKKPTAKTMLFYILAIIFGGVALLLKPFAAFFLLPILYLSWATFGRSMVKKWQLYLFVVLVALPLILWRFWIAQYPEGIPASTWLFNANNIRFKGSFFYWLFADRIGRLILGYWGVALFVIGILANSSKAQIKKQGWFFYSFIIATLLYMTVVAAGNVQHDYYQIPIIPSLVIFLGLGARLLLFPPEELFNKIVARGMLLVCIAFTLVFGWFFVRDFFNINNPAIIEAGKIVAEKTPHDAKVIALYDGDTSFLYQTQRSGWASYQNDLPVMIQKGAQYLVMVNPQERDIQSLGSQYEIIAQSPTYLLIKLK